MGKTEWFSVDDDDNVIAKSEIQDDGTVHRYEYTTPDKISDGHGHCQWDSLDSYLSDNEHPDNTYRTKDDSKSINRHWSGNGYDLSLETLNSLSLERLQELLDLAENDYIHTSEEMFVKGIHKQLVLKNKFIY